MDFGEANSERSHKAPKTKLLFR